MVASRSVLEIGFHSAINSALRLHSNLNKNDTRKRQDEEVGNQIKTNYKQCLSWREKMTRSNYIQGKMRHVALKQEKNWRPLYSTVTNNFVAASLLKDNTTSKASIFSDQITKSRNRN